MKDFTATATSEDLRTPEGMQSVPAYSGIASRFEKEADRAADAVVGGRTPPFSFSRVPVNPASSPPEQSELEEDFDVMLKPTDYKSDNGQTSTPLFRSSGEPLEAATRRTMEARFGFDFSGVRVHHDESAGDTARNLGALAYTAGQHIGFGKNEYAPGTPAGEHLLAHELAHTRQQQDSGRPFVQRAEFGTYVSKKGDAPYLDAGAQYYSTWGFPNVKRVDNIKDVLDDLDRSAGIIEKFRIVSHGNSLGLKLGAVPGLTSQPSEGLDMKEWFTSKGAEFSDEARFRKHFTDAGTQSLVTESFFQRIIQDVRADAVMQPVLKRLGADKSVPAADTPTGVVLRALVDKFYLGKVKLDTGGAPTFANRTVLDQFVNLRVSAFKTPAVQAAPAAQQSDVEQAFVDFSAALPTAFDGAGLKFTDVTKDEARTLADTYAEPGSSSKKLDTDITTALTEGAAGGGPFVKKLRSVKGKVDKTTHVEIRGCNVGSDVNTLDSFRTFFGRPKDLPSISAPDLFQFFFQLNYSTYTQAPQNVTDLNNAFNTPTTGVAQAFEDKRRRAAGEMMRVVNEPSLDEFAAKYGFNLPDLKRWNPQIATPKSISPGDEVWLMMRPEAPAGIHTTLKDFCKVYIGDEKALDDVKAANPQITNPDALSPTDQISIPKTRQTAKVAAPKAVLADFVSAVRGGEAVTAINASNRPETHMDDTQRAASLSTWLVKQQFDPKGRTATELAKLYAGATFATQAARTYINFLTRGYPNIEDPIFPEDQRYDKHIIRRP